MTVNVSWQQAGAWIARIGAVALIALGAIQSSGVAGAARPWLAVAGAIIIAVDRYVTDPTTGTPTPTPTPTVKPAPAPAPPPG
jgi:hypothetical protein